MLEIPLQEAEGHLAELIARAESGEEVVVTREGRPVARVVAHLPVEELEGEALAERRRILLRRLQAEASAKALPGPCAARAADFLYDEDGLPA